MKFTKLQVYGKVSNTQEGLIVLVEDEGWMHIAKLPFDHDNIFFSKEELEAVAGESLVLLAEHDIDDQTEEFNEWKKEKGIL